MSNNPNIKLLEFVAGFMLHVMTAMGTVGIMFCAFAFAAWEFNPAGWHEMTRGMFAVWSLFALLVSNGIILEAAELRKKFIAALGGE